MANAYDFMKATRKIINIYLVPLALTITNLFHSAVMPYSMYQNKLMHSNKPYSDTDGHIVFFEEKLK